MPEICFSVVFRLLEGAATLLCIIRNLGLDLALDFLLKNGAVTLLWIRHASHHRFEGVADVVSNGIPTLQFEILWTPTAGFSVGPVERGGYIPSRQPHNVGFR